MELVFGRDVEVAGLVSEQIGANIVPPYVGVGVAKDGVLIGGAIFNVYTGADICLTIAGRGILTRKVMKALAEYAFLQAKCRRVSMTVRLSNREVHHLAGRCGFKIEGMKQRAYDDEGAIMYGLLPEDFPWLKFEVSNGLGS